MRLVHEDTRQEVQIGDEVILPNTDVVKLVKFGPPNKPTALGACIVEYPTGVQTECSVVDIGAKWVEREDQNPKPQLFSPNIKAKPKKVKAKKAKKWRAYEDRILLRMTKANAPIEAIVEALKQNKRTYASVMSRRRDKGLTVKNGYVAKAATPKPLPKLEVAQQPTKTVAEGIKEVQDRSLLKKVVPQLEPTDQDLLITKKTLEALGIKCKWKLEVQVG